LDYINLEFQSDYTGLAFSNRAVPLYNNYNESITVNATKHNQWKIWYYTCITDVLGFNKIAQMCKYK
jgi:hypothetical protein